MIAAVSDWTFEPPALRCLKGLIELFDYLDDCLARMVGRGGLEPPTSRLSGVRSNHLSYRPILVRAVCKVVEPRRIELLTS